MNSLLVFIVICIASICITLIIVSLIIGKEKLKYKEYIILIIGIILSIIFLHHLKLYKENTYIKANNSILTRYSYSCNMNALYLNSSGKYSQNTISCEYIEMKYNKKEN
jgi:hypothetical protein